MTGKLTPEEVDLIDGLFAWDTGSRSSGIHDPAGRARMRAKLATLTLREIVDHAVERYGAPPYTLEDVGSFLEWISLDMAVTPLAAAPDHQAEAVKDWDRVHDRPADMTPRQPREGETMTDAIEGVARIQYERDVESALSDIGKLVAEHGLSWEQDAFYELEVIVREAVGLPVPAAGGTEDTGDAQ